MINKIIQYTQNFSLTDNIKFADKTFKFDTIFYGSKLLKNYSHNNLIKLDKEKRGEIITGFKIHLQLKNTEKSKDANSNYLSETLEFLCLTNILKKIEKDNYKIVAPDIFDYISLCMETSYIFQYITAYQIFKNGHLWNNYVDFCNTNSLSKKEEILISKLVPQIEYLLPKKGWTKFQTKFFMNVLGLVNVQPQIARTLNIKEQPVSPEDLSNREGTRSETVKNNLYAEKFNFATTQYMLKDYLAIDKKFLNTPLAKFEKFNETDLPPEILKVRKQLMELSEKTLDNQENIDKILASYRKKLETMSYQEINTIINKVNCINLQKQVKANLRDRDMFLVDLVKHQSNFSDEFDGEQTFIGKDGNNYVEAHHIIEFKKEKGPDISLNLICLSPKHHSLLHHGSDKAVKEFFGKCRENNTITIKRFEKMCTQHQCLTPRHVEILLKKNLISQDESKNLLNLIRVFGCANAPK